MLPAGEEEKEMSKPVRYTLGFLLSFVALNAFAGGYYGMAGAKDIPPGWLDGTPFSTYFIPSLFLFVIIGGSCLFAAIAVFKKHPLGTKIALIAGAIIIVWLVVQLMMIGYVSWMQPVTASIALVIILITFLTPSNAV
jgi:hypothetical protein